MDVHIHQAGKDGYVTQVYDSAVFWERLWIKARDAITIHDNGGG